MNGKLIRFSLLISLVMSSSLSGINLKANAQKKLTFICASGRQNNKIYPTTYAIKSLQIEDKKPLIYWQYSWFSNRKMTPRERCEIVSSRFQEAYNNESLRFITNSKINEQPVICTTKKLGGDCVTILLTLRQSDDSIQILRQLKDRLRGRGGEIIRHSSNPDNISIYYEIDIDKLIKN
ncbi:MAG: COP23 domain-containing protein [Crocosphaera sp.]|nr:COP23 domain-containing protein [Crocosphaera sp.]